MATSQKRNKIDPTKYKDIIYLHDYFVGLNEKKKKQRESTFEIHKKSSNNFASGTHNCL